MIQIQLEKFEGPLALLLHLIRKNEMDIYDIEIHKITQQYLEYINVMKNLDLEVAGDFVAMAATLIHIKSKMLLPDYDEQGEVLETHDPRKELVQRLLEYQRFQEVAQTLGKRPLLGREAWARGLREHLGEGDAEIIVEEGGLFALISHYRRTMQKAKRRVHVVFRKAQSLASRVLEIRHLLIPGGRLEMSDLLVPFEKTRSKLVITFLSVLELAKLGFVSVFQADTYGPIYLDVRKQVQGDIVSQLQEYENLPQDEAQVQLELEPEPLMMTPPPEARVVATASIEPEAATDDEIAELEKELGLAPLEPSLEGVPAEILAAYEDDESGVSVDEVRTEPMETRFDPEKVSEPPSTPAQSEVSAGQGGADPVPGLTPEDKPLDV